MKAYAHIAGTSGECNDGTEPAFAPVRKGCLSVRVRERPTPADVTIPHYHAQPRNVRWTSRPLREFRPRTSDHRRRARGSTHRPVRPSLRATFAAAPRPIGRGPAGRARRREDADL